MANKKLDGLRVATLLADGFERESLMEPVAALRHEGAKVDLVGPERNHVHAMHGMTLSGSLRVDHAVFEANPRDYDALLIVDGLFATDTLRQNDEVLAFVRAFEREAKPIGVIGHGVWILVSAGLAEGRRMTSAPGARDDVVNAGATWIYEPIVHDATWLTCRGPDALPAFIPEVIALFAEYEPLRAHAIEQRHHARARLEHWLVAGAAALVSALALRRLAR